MWAEKEGRMPGNWSKWIGPPRWPAQAGPLSTRRETKKIPDVLEFTRKSLKFPADEMQALALRGGRRVIVNCTRQWGKSTVAAAKAVYRAFSRPESLTLVVAPTLRQSGELIRKAEIFAGRLGIKARGDGTNEVSLAFPNGSRIVGLPNDDKTTRGFSAVSLLLIEEAAWVPDDVYQAMRPTLAVGDGDLCLMSTPGGKRGFFHGVWEHGGPEWERICVPATACPRIEKSFLDGERAAMDENKFRQEYLCEFVDAEGRIFSQDSIDAALAEDYPGLEL